MSFWSEALIWAERGERMALVTVIGVRGSAPRHTGARMLVNADGQTLASVGGGRIEWALVQAAQQAAASGRGARMKHHLVRDLGMCCGGAMDAVITPVSSASLPVLRQIVQAHAQRQPIHVMTATDGASLAATIAAEPAANSDAVFVEVVQPAPRLFIFGAGHVGRALAPLARNVGFWVCVCDDEEIGAINAAADAVVSSFDWPAVTAQLDPGPQPWAVVLTRDHAIDQRIIEQLLVYEWTYLGLIGSRSKRERFRQRLVAKGIDLAAWDRVRCPVGLDIGAETPAEIAIAICAELVQHAAALRRAQ